MAADDDSMSDYQPLIDRLLACGAADPPDAELIRDLTNAVYERLRRLVAKIMNVSFPAVGRRHEVDSVLNATWLRLNTALASLAKKGKSPPTPLDFFRLAAKKVRQVLIDLTRTDARYPQAAADPDDDSGVDMLELSHHTLDPVRLSMWRELHERVGKLPADERRVFELHFYAGMPQAQIARLFGLEARPVSRLWRAAVVELADHLPE